MKSMCFSVFQDLETSLTGVPSGERGHDHDDDLGEVQNKRQPMGTDYPGHRGARHARLRLGNRNERRVQVGVLVLINLAQLFK
jgi:hypothetical protein